jgi:protein-tyrosine-phosphatase
MKRLINLVILSMMVVFTLANAAFADIYMKQKVHTDAIQMMGMAQPANDVIAKIWITEKGFRSDDPANSTIMLGKEQKIIMIDHAAKTYTEQPMNMNDMMAAMGEGETPEDQAAMQQMMQNLMKMDAVVQETKDQKTINGWKCRKYIMTVNSAMGPITNEVWATEDLKVDRKVYEQLATRMLASMPGLQNSVEGMKKEIAKIKGVQVMTKSTFTMMGQTHNTTTEMLEFKEGPAPAGIFDIPAGYKKQMMQQ